jgi:DNA-directed RNA polymerase II subunit RPB2
MINFEQVFVALPVTRENDGSSKEMYPHDARLRNMTYACSIYMQITAKQFEINRNKQIIYPNKPTFVFPPSDVCICIVFFSFEIHVF